MPHPGEIAFSLPNLFPDGRTRSGIRQDPCFDIFIGGDLICSGTELDRQRSCGAKLVALESGRGKRKKKDQQATYLSQ